MEKAVTVSPPRMLKELEPLLRKYGLWIERWEQATRHRKVWVTDGVKTGLIYVSTSPSDFRAYRNVVKSARNAVREAR